jgi:hypothetical protein
VSSSKQSSGEKVAVRLQLNVKQKMRDGTLLSSDIYFPDAKGRFPHHNPRTPYSTLDDFQTRLARRRALFCISRLRLPHPRIARERTNQKESTTVSSTILMEPVSYLPDSYGNDTEIVDGATIVADVTTGFLSVRCSVRLTLQTVGSKPT